MKIHASRNLPLEVALPSRVAGTDLESACQAAAIAMGYKATTQDFGQCWGGYAGTEIYVEALMTRLTVDLFRRDEEQENLRIRREGLFASEKSMKRYVQHVLQYLQPGRNFCSI